MKAIWSSKANQAAATYAENAPMAAVCCNMCRSCVTTNAVGLALAGATAVGAGITRLVRRRFADLS